MRKFYALDEVAEQLSVSISQMRALVRNGDLEGIQIGGRNQWRIEDIKLEEYIERLYAEQRQARQED